MIIKQRTCKDCDEPFEPVGRERICPECRLERDIDAEDRHDQSKALGVEKNIKSFFGGSPEPQEFVDITEEMRQEDEDFEGFHHFGWGED